MPERAAAPRGLYLVTPEMSDTDALLRAVDWALAGRPALLQYRSKLADEGLRREQAARVGALCRAGGVPFIVNDRVDLALALDADGVHLGRDDGDPVAARRALGPHRILGISCYDEWGRAEAAAAAGADYIAFGAMFASPTKPAAVRAPLALLSRARRELSVRVAAIGGISLDNAPAVVEAGADLVAVVSDVFASADPGARARAYQSLFAD